MTYISVTLVIFANFILFSKILLTQAIVKMKKTNKFVALELQSVIEDFVNTYRLCQVRIDEYLKDI